MSDRSRRDALKVVAATLPVLPVLNAQQTHQHHAETAEVKKAVNKPYTPKALTKNELETLAQLVDLIIPRTETPGARDADVHVSIDKMCALSSRLKAEISTGLAELDSQANREHQMPFARLKEAQQIAMLRPMSEANAPFFANVKGLTVEAYYTSKEGLVQELNWNANTFVADFKGCTHKEHQA